MVAAAATLALRQRGLVSKGTLEPLQFRQASPDPALASVFAISFDRRGLTRLAAARDRYGAQMLEPGGRVEVVLKYRVKGGD